MKCLKLASDVSNQRAQYYANIQKFSRNYVERCLRKCIFCPNGQIVEVCIGSISTCLNLQVLLSPQFALFPQTFVEGCFCLRWCLSVSMFVNISLQILQGRSSWVSMSLSHSHSPSPHCMWHIISSLCFVPIWTFNNSSVRNISSQDSQ